MKLRGTLTQLGLSWLDRLLPAFEKLSMNRNFTVTLYFNPTQMSLVVRPDDIVGNGGFFGTTTTFGGGAVGGSVDAHADVRIFNTTTTNNDNDVNDDPEEMFERKSYVCTSIADNQIAFKVDANGLSRVVKGLVHVNATGARVRLLRRERRRKEENKTTHDNNNNNNDNDNNNAQGQQQQGGLTPVLCFSSFGGEIDIVQDVPIYGPLGRREVEDIARAIDTRRFEEVPYWLDLDYQSASVLREAVERLKFVSPRVEVVVGREGVVHIAGEKTATASAGVELRGVPVAPRVVVDEDDEGERRRGSARTAQLRLAEMRAIAVRNKNNNYSTQQKTNTDDNDPLPPVAMRGILSAKQLGKGFLGTMTRPDVVFFGFADNARRLEMVHRFYSARQVVVDKETGATEESQDSVIVRFRIPVEEEEDEMEGEDEYVGDVENNNAVERGGGERGQQQQQQQQRSLVFAPRSPANDDASLNAENAARALLGVQKRRREPNDDGDRDSFLDD